MVSLNGKSYEFRPVVMDDVAELRLLVNEAYQELSDLGLNYTATDQDEETTRRRLSEGRAFVMLDGGNLIATVLLSEKNHYTNRRSAYINQFAVKPAYKKSGLGRFLMDFCEDMARREGFQSMQLDTAKPARHLVQWYLKLGYRIVGEAYWAGKTYESYIFEKDIQNCITALSDTAEKSKICGDILRQLPNWFGIPSAIDDYCKNIQNQQAWSLHVNNELAGVISVVQQSDQSAELAVMGILEKYQGQGWGQKLVQVVEDYLSSRGFHFLQVKTLSASRTDQYYDKTRNFYLRCGFKPIEEIRNLWGVENPCLLMGKQIKFSPELQLKAFNLRTQNFTHLFELETALHRNEVRSNRAILERFLAPDFFEYGSSGKVWSREDILKRLPTETDEEKIEAVDFQGRYLSEDIVQITYKSVHTVGNSLLKFSKKRICLRTSIWKNTGVGWAMVFHQGTEC